MLFAALLLSATMHPPAAMSQSYDSGVGSCLGPIEPFPYKLSEADPLYEAARDEHQKYLEDIEGYVKCLDEERAAAIAAFKDSYKLFRENFGSDAVFRYVE